MTKEEFSELFSEQRKQWIENGNAIKYPNSSQTFFYFLQDNVISENEYGLTMLSIKEEELHSFDCSNLSLLSNKNNIPLLYQN